MLRVESVNYQVKGRFLLKDVSFSIHRGEMVAILGANGAGKSTLMRILSGEIQPSAGKVVIDSKKIGDCSKKELAQKRAMLQQQNTVTMGFTAKEIVLMGRYGQFNGNPRPEDYKAVSETMDICGISDLGERSMLTLSGGEQQRVHLARVLAQIWDSNYAMLLLDEPLNNMDLQFQHQTMGIAAALARKGFIVIAVLHDINLAAQYASRILMLKAGRKWWDGQPENVLTPSHIYTAFGINARTQIDQHNLKTYILPQEVMLEASSFNSNIRSKSSLEIAH